MLARGMAKRNAASAAIISSKRAKINRRGIAIASVRLFGDKEMLGMTLPKSWRRRRAAAAPQKFGDGAAGEKLAPWRSVPISCRLFSAGCVHAAGEITNQEAIAAIIMQDIRRQ